MLKGAEDAVSGPTAFPVLQGVCPPSLHRKPIKRLVAALVIKVS